MGRLLECPPSESCLSFQVSAPPPPCPKGVGSLELILNEAQPKIKGIADQMVETGMRDAGYTYLVLDDGWMTDTRESDGTLLADPNKFPSGMKALGDYIHSKGLKFGIYGSAKTWGLLRMAIRPPSSNNTTMCC